MDDSTRTIPPAAPPTPGDPRSLPHSQSPSGDQHHAAAPDGWGAAPAAAPDGWDAAPAAAPDGWDAAPTATTTRAPGAEPSAADPYAAEWNTAQQTPTPWYGQAGTPRSTKPRPPWFWPVVATAVGVGALLAGGGIGFAVGHAISGQSQGTSQFPGRGTNGFPGYGGGTGQFPGGAQGGGTGTQDGTGSGTGSGSESGTGTGSGSGS